MRVVPDFNIGQKVWFFRYNKICNGVVDRISFEGLIDENGNAYISTQYRVDKSLLFGECDIFASEDELLEYACSCDWDSI